MALLLNGTESDAEKYHVCHKLLLLLYIQSHCLHFKCEMCCCHSCVLNTLFIIYIVGSLGLVMFSIDSVLTLVFVF